MEEQHQTTVIVTTTTHTETVQSTSAPRRTICTINTGYFKSWQGLLKILKLLFGIACIIVSAIATSSVAGYVIVGYVAYPLAVSAVTFVTELIWFLLYIFAINRSFPKGIPYVIIIYHIFCSILFYAAVIVISNLGGATASAFVAFGVLQLSLFFMEAYFNVTWLNGGPELIALPCVRVHG